jgi:hypothetical protein
MTLNFIYETAFKKCKFVYILAFFAVHDQLYAEKGFF